MRQEFNLGTWCNNHDGHLSCVTTNCDTLVTHIMWHTDNEVGEQNRRSKKSNYLSFSVWNGIRYVTANIFVHHCGLYVTPQRSICDYANVFSDRTRTWDRKYVRSSGFAAVWATKICQYSTDSERDFLSPYANRIAIWATLVTENRENGDGILFYCTNHVLPIVYLQVFRFKEL